MSAVTFTNTDEERQARFQRALDLVITPAERERHGIGMQMEKTLHAVLKAYEDPEEDHQEIPIEEYIADIYNENGITEIQTAGFDRLRNKLQCFLPLYPVTVVYPIPAQKWVIWIDPDELDALAFPGAMRVPLKEAVRLGAPTKEDRHEG